MASSKKEDYLETLLKSVKEQPVYDEEGGIKSRADTRKVRVRQKYYQTLEESQEHGFSSSCSKFVYLYIFGMAVSGVLIYLFWRYEIMV